MSLNLKELLQNNEKLNDWHYIDAITKAIMLSAIISIILSPLMLIVHINIILKISIMLLLFCSLSILLTKVNIACYLVKDKTVFFVKENKQCKLSTNDIYLLTHREDDNIYFINIDKNNNKSYIAIRDNEIYYNNEYDYKISANHFGQKSLIIMNNNNIIESVNLKDVLFTFE